MRRLLTVALAFALLGLALPLRAQTARPLQVVASFSILADMAREVAGDAAQVHALVGPNADAHVYEPTPADQRAVAGAAVLIANGLGFEPWLGRLVNRVQRSDRCPPWTFGSVALMRNLAARGLLQ